MYFEGEDVLRACRLDKAGTREEGRGELNLNHRKVERGKRKGKIQRSRRKAKGPPKEERDREDDGGK
ncbi:hypothetical protein BDW42DRAFT_181562 [Aspergillus taichungensis]|uniref:Uncharacterized protein n=1 Tax=Aspergillus taichungensis TaxID=482145 RepID=A0A2J5HDM3_9EURO|nr:hypothetical protein BDW42DRAFT_181562 [Aspergillus taichungensis]